jgi:hypothetical protein
MLRNKDLYEEISQIDEIVKQEKDIRWKALLKIGTLGLKLLHNIRTNLVSLMTKLGADKITAPTAHIEPIVPEKTSEKIEKVKGK